MLDRSMVSAAFADNGGTDVGPNPLLDTGLVDIGDQDPETYRQRLEAKLRPERIRATLSFAGLYQMTHELIKTAVLDEVRGFYWRGIEEGVKIYDERAYADNVLVKAPKNKFRASLLWLAESQAITLTQADRLEDIYAHRHDLSHELIKYIVDPDFEPDAELFADALRILQAIRRFGQALKRTSVPLRTSVTWTSTRSRRCRWRYFRLASMPTSQGCPSRSSDPTSKRPGPLGPILLCRKAPRMSGCSLCVEHLPR